MTLASEHSLRSFKQKVKSVTARPFWLRYATLAPYRILCAGASALTGLTRSGARHASGNVENSVAYIASVFSMYKAASGVKQFHGKVAEIGPGDSCGIGLMFLADGCEQVDLVDRFFSARDEQHQQRMNRNLAESFLNWKHFAGTAVTWKHPSPVWPGITANQRRPRPFSGTTGITTTSCPAR